MATVLDTDVLPGLSRTERGAVLESWLTGLLTEAVAGTPRPAPRRGAASVPDDTGVALVAVGSLGRRELPPHGDLDLVLVHDGRAGIGAIADALWYPIWDAGLRLDHSVRTVGEAVSVAAGDVKAGLGLLDVRLVAGDAALAATLRSATLSSWRQHANELLPQLRDLRRTRGRQVGELGFLLEPDLKEAYGGLREGQVLRALAAAQLADEPPADAGEAYAFLLDVRDALRRSNGRAGDALVRQAQRPVAEALGMADDDVLLRQVSLAGRRLAFVADETWRRVDAAMVRRPRSRYRRVRREPLAEGLVRQGDEVVLARDARPAVDPGWCCAAPPRPPGPTCCCRPTRSRCWPRTLRRCPSRGRRRSAGPSCGCWPAGAVRCRFWSSWTRRGCCPGCSPSGTGCARCPSAIRGTGSPSTGTWSRPRLRRRS
ncbi:hypothetical protein [Modestobacter sp. DSM 44400]|uniref:[protein-PII] uridylyltransferase family protein n=1 Tax=Modestobacter sp. DSM 44400 TaxID=1550230 RepID=UPI0020C83E26|nr:hypothetical protein [Modestobacter sp. DSM 44400]